MNPLLEMNPLHYEHKIVLEQGYFTVNNAQIFNFCHSVGLSLDLLTRLMPHHKDDQPRHVGNMHGIIVFINGSGRFELKTTIDSVIDPVAIDAYDGDYFDPDAEIYTKEEYYEEEDEDACNHEDFLVYNVDDQGNIYWCKICDERFPKHPENIAAEKNLPKAVQPDGNLSEAIEKFRAGIVTLTDIAKEFNVACETLSETIRLNFAAKPIYEDQYAPGQKTPFGRVCVDVDLPRQSDPLEVEKFFEDMSIYVPDIQSDMHNKFPDIVNVTINCDIPDFIGKPLTRMQIPHNDDFYYEILFIDESVQKVYPKWSKK
jgi:hypothetical protein